MSTTSRPRSAPRARPRRRLAPDQRRRELLRAAEELLTAEGVDGVQLAEVAARAGVTRPLVYRFFASRQALILAVLEDYTEDLTARFGRGAMRSIPGSNEEVTRVFVETVCDTIAARGSGPWHLLDSKGPDPEIARRGQALMDRLLDPWRARLREVTGATERESITLARMIVAAGRAVLDLWCAGRLSRAEAIRDTTRGVSGLVEAFRRVEVRGTPSPRTARTRRVARQGELSPTLRGGRRRPRRAVRSGTR